MRTRTVISAIDLSCGTGGLSLSLKQGGVYVVAGIDNAASCAYPYEENIKAKFVRESVREITGDELKRSQGRSSVRLLARCAPCRPFSSQRRGVDTPREQSRPLLPEFGRLVRETTPDCIIIENVPRLQKSEVFEKFMSILRETGHQVAHSVLFGPDYGLPQRHRRFVLLAGWGTDVPISSSAVDKDSYRTVFDAIQDLPPLSAGEYDPDNRLHFARNLAPLNLRRIQASKLGGTWKDWPGELLLGCQKETTGSTFKSFYGRIEWGKPLPTITTQSYNPDTGRFTHPEQGRTLTLREALRLQGFPDSFMFTKPGEPIAFINVGRLIGNAVPPVFDKAIACQVVVVEKEKRNQDNE